LMIIVLLSEPQQMTTRRRSYVGIGMLALILASVIHVMFFLVVALAASALWLRSRRTVSTQRRVIGFALLAIIVTYVVMPQNVLNIESVARKAVDLEATNIPRAILLARVVYELPESAPRQPLVGLGPGQFCSRAGLIASGMHFSHTTRSLPFLPFQATGLAQDYCSVLQPFRDTESIIGSSQQPFFSYLTIYTEIGLLGIIAVALTALSILRRIRQRVTQHADLGSQLTLTAAAILFIFLIGWQENYWEAPQALFVGILLIKIRYATVMHPVEEPSLVSN
jgi:hypothetical protein